MWIRSRALGGVEPRFAHWAVVMWVSSLSVGLASCSAGPAFDDPFAEYQQRTVLVSTTGGEAQAAITAVQTATPWPRFANSTSIPVDGALMAKAVQRYESGATSESSTQTPNYAGGNGATNGVSPGTATSQPAAPPGQ